MEIARLLSGADFITPSFIASSILVSITAYFMITKFTRERNLPPMGAMAFPFVGSLFSLIGEKPARAFQKMSKKAGPIFRVYFGPKLVVVLNDFASVRQAFVKMGDDMCTRPSIPRKGGLVTSPLTPIFKEHRKFTLLSLRSLGMGNKNAMEERIGEEMDHLVKAFEDTGGKPIDPEPLIMRSVANVISAIAFGERFDYKDATFLLLLDYVRYLFSSTQQAASFILNWPVIRQLTALINRMRGAVPSWQEIIQGVVNSAAEASATDRDHMSYVSMYKDETKRRTDSDDADDTFSAQRLRCNITDLFSAGTETTTTTLRWALLTMITHPDIQKQIQDEIDRVIGSNRHPVIQDRPNLPYTEAFLMELQRYASVAPLGVPHAALVDTTLCGYRIPKGAFVIGNQWGIHHDPEVWDDPEKIKPERFLDTEGRVVHRDELIPFGIGRRRCLGEQLAVTELYLAFTRLVQKFTFRIPEGAPVPSLDGVMLIANAPRDFKVCALSR